MEFKDIKTIGIVGAGTMGQGIAQVCAQAGYTTLLFDVNKDLLVKAIGSVDQNLIRAVEKGKLSAIEKEQIKKQIILIEQLTNVKADLIIEAVIENLEIKQKLFADIEGKPKTYNVQFVCIKGARVLWIGETGFGKKE